MSTFNPGHNPSDIKSLDVARHRLLQLSNALASLRRDIEISDPLPPWSTILTTSHLLSHHLNSLTTHLSTTFNTHSDTSLSNFSLGGQPHVYPLPSFPFGQEKENILGQLLRKKLDPEVEEWIESAGAAVSASNGTDDDAHGARLPSEQQEELWNWAKPRAGELAAQIPWGLDYSIAEREGGIENIATGLKRKLEAGLDDDDDDDDDEEEDEDDEDGKDKDEDEDMANTEQSNRIKVEKLGGKENGNTSRQDQKQQAESPDVLMMPLDDLLRFMSTGVLPRTNASIMARNGIPGLGIR